VLTWRQAGAKAAKTAAGVTAGRRRNAAATTSGLCSGGRGTDGAAGTAVVEWLVGSRGGGSLPVQAPASHAQFVLLF